MVHIGKEIEAVVRNKRIGISELAALINKSRPVVYDIFQRETIDTGLLEVLSRVLDYNFFNCFIKSNEVEEGAAEYKLKADQKIRDLESRLMMVEAELQNARKEIDYLKRINKLLEEKKGG